MDDTRLPEWALATFHTSAFVATALTILYVRGALGDLLASLNTLLGVAAFGVFWLVTWWTTRQAVQRISWSGVGAPIPFRPIVVHGTQWGGINGALIFLALLAAVVASLLVGEPAELVNAALFLVFAVVLGTAVATVVGAVVGLVLALVDSALLALTQYVYKRYQSSP